MRRFETASVNVAVKPCPHSRRFVRPSPFSVTLLSPSPKSAIVASVEGYNDAVLEELRCSGVAGSNSVCYSDGWCVAFRILPT